MGKRFRILSQGKLSSVHAGGGRTSCQVGLLALSALLMPCAAWGQSSWPSFPNNTAISVTNSGNVGIGTSSPSGPLHVASNPGNVGSNTYLENTAGASNLKNQIIFRGNGSNRWSVGNDMTANAGQNFYVYDVVAGAARVFVDGSGHVGIGTTSPCPNAYAPSNCVLSAAGAIQAYEVVVNTGWSDYVFSPDYPLMPIADVASYIKANHHLPGIPSGAEVQEKGVSLGEMQSRLLAKIEELTLHMIQAEERNRELQERIARLEAGAIHSNSAAAAEESQ